MRWTPPAPASTRSAAPCGRSGGSANWTTNRWRHRSTRTGSRSGRRWTVPGQDRQKSATTCRWGRTRR
ncbi:hypothetical protein C4K40_3667 [Pseudomonas sp. CMR5c]|nr:hypothetical protein C4K40_3667 [Pseudomonas sp. CMR5c]